MLEKKRIAFVIQRYGQEVNGGAELFTRWLAERLTVMAEVHVITTCAIDHQTWANAYPPGDSEVNGVTIHRFTVDAERRPDFPEQTAALFRGTHSFFDEYQWMKDHGPFSARLFDYIRAAYNYYDLFIFVTYLYPPTYFGLSLVPDKAILIPMAHDEPYLRLAIFRSLFHMARAILYNTEPEKQLVAQIIPNVRAPQLVVGVGVNTPEGGSAERFRQKYGIEEPVVIYVGRIDEGKNVPELLEYFARFRQETGRPLKLVLLGKPTIELPARPDIAPLGFVSEQDKFDAIRAADVLIVPSKYESLSIIALEAWLMERPALLNGHCEVLKHQARQSNAGLYYHTYDEFATALKLLLDNPDLRAKMGRQGKAFVKAHYQWDVVMAKYRAILEMFTAPTP